MPRSPLLFSPDQDAPIETQKSLTEPAKMGVKPLQSVIALAIKTKGLWVPVLLLVLVVLFIRHEKSKTFPENPVRTSTIAYWTSVIDIQRRASTLPDPDPELLKDSSRWYFFYSSTFDSTCDGLETNASKHCQSMEQLKDELDHLPITNVDPKAVAFGSQVSLMLSHGGDYYRHAADLVSAAKEYRNKIVGIGAFASAALNPHRALDDIFGSGSREFEDKCDHSEGEYKQLQDEQSLIKSSEASTRVDLTERLGGQYP